MSGNIQSIEGKVVSEAEVAQGLGFKNIDEFHRWRTDLGKENMELKYALYKSKNEATGFRWNLMRSHRTLDLVRPVVEQAYNAEYDTDKKDYLRKLLLAIDNMFGNRPHGIDWKHEITAWYEDIKAPYISFDEATKV